MLRRQLARGRSAPSKPQGQIVDRRQPRERKRTEHDPEVAQGDVTEAGVREEIEDDPGESPGNDVRVVARLQCDDGPSEYLNGAVDIHELLG